MAAKIRAMNRAVGTSWLASTLRDLRRDWNEIGRLGRVAFIGVVASVVVAVVLGFAITASVRGHLLHVRTDLLANVSSDLATLAPSPPGSGTEAYARFDSEVRLRLLGGETVRVKLWAPDGTILYSDAAALEGRRFELSAPAQRAFEGEASSQVSDLSDPAHEFERELGDLIEFYIPFAEGDEPPTAVFEVEQRTDSLDAATGHITGNVWLAIGSGIGILTVFLALLFAARTRDLNRRRRQAEELLGALFRAQEEERRRVVGALHDDVGQPLYRLLYGLEGSRAKLAPDDPIAAELSGLQRVVREIDSTLRTELEALHEGLAEDAGLETALRDLAVKSEEEAGLDVGITVDQVAQLPAPSRTVLFRAAQEAVMNIRKHAVAHRVDVRVSGSPGTAVLTVEDDGRGWDGSTGLGLVTTRERLEAIGGGLEVVRRREGGTRFTAWVPTDPGGLT